MAIRKKVKIFLIKETKLIEIEKNICYNEINK